MATLLAQGLHDGKAEARLQPVAGRFMGGFAGGFALGFIGTGIVYGLAASSDGAPPPESLILIADRPAAYQRGYEQGYAREIRQRRSTYAALGGAAGTAAIVALILATGSGTGG